MNAQTTPIFQPGHVTQKATFADVHVTPGAFVDLDKPIAPRIIAGLHNPALAYKERYGKWGSRHTWEEAEYDLWEPGLIEDTESYFRQFIRKKKGLAFKEGYEFIGKDPETIGYILDRFSWIEAAQGKSMRQLLKEAMHELLQKSNCYWIKIRKTNSSNGKLRRVGGRLLQPVAGYFIAPAETIQVRRKNDGTIVKARQLMPNGKKGEEINGIDIVHFTLDKKVGHPIGTPIIEPVKDDIRTLRRMEEHVDLLIYQHLFPLFQYIVGTKDKPAMVYPDGTSEVDVVERKVEFLPPEGVIVTPERHEVKLIGADGKALKAAELLEYFKKRVFSGFGSSAVDFGEGDTSNKATANTLSGNTIDDVKDIQDDLEMQFDWQVLRELLLEGGFNFNPLHRDHEVRLHFKEIDLEAKMKVENHVAQMFEQYIINEDEARQEIGREPKELEDEDYRPKTFWRMIKEPETLMIAGDEAYLSTVASMPNTSVDEQALAKGEEMKNKAAERDTKQKIAIAKAKPVASSGQRQGASKNRPSNQHGTRASATTRGSRDIVEHLIERAFATNTLHTLDKRIAALVTQEFCSGAAENQVDPHQSLEGLQKIRDIRSRAILSVSRITNALTNSLAIVNTDMADSLKEIHYNRIQDICCELLDQSYTEGQSYQQEPVIKMQDSVEFKDSMQTLLYKRHLLVSDEDRATVLREWIPPKRNALMLAWPDFVVAQNYKLTGPFQFHWATGQKVALSYSDVECAPGIYREVLYSAHYFIQDSKGHNLIVQLNMDGFWPGIVVNCKDTNRKAAKDLIEKFDAYTKENNFLRGHLIDIRGQFVKTDLVTWNDIILKDEIKDQIKRNVIGFLDKLPIYVKNKQPAKRGILLEGPPGTGKTLAFKAIANEVKDDITCLWVSSGDISIPSRFAWLYELGRDLAPSVIFLEDIDTHGGDRATKGQDPYIGELLNQLDGMKSNAGVVTLASTNFVGQLDNALRDRPGRFDIKIHLDAPELPEVKEMLHTFLSNVIVDQSIIDSIAEDVVGLTGAYIREVAMQAVSLAIDDNSIDGNDIAIVTEQHLQKAIDSIKANRAQYADQR